jgi:protein gp37
VNLTTIGRWRDEPLSALEEIVGYVERPRLDWVIVGGESGPDPRLMKPEWVREIRDQCVEAGVPFFFKQHGGRHSKAGGRELDGREWNEMPQTKVGA